MNEVNNSVLEKEEIDEILKDESMDSDKNTKVKKFDFSTGTIIRSKMPALETILEKFIRNLQPSISEYMRRNIEIKSLGVDVLKFGEYSSSLYKPTSINVVKINPLRGKSLIVFDPKLIYMLVDNYYGGSGKINTKSEARNFTVAENRLISKLLSMIYKDLTEAWKYLYNIDFNYQGCELDPNMVTILSPGELVVVTKVGIELSGGVGEIHIAIPYASLEPIKELLESEVQASSDDRDERWLNQLHEDIFDASVLVKGIIATKKITVSKLAKLKEGDIIPIELPETTLVFASSIPTFRAKIGEVDGKYAFKILTEATIGSKMEKGNG